MLTAQMDQINTAVDNLLGERRKLEQAVNSKDPTKVKYAFNEFQQQLSVLCNNTNSYLPAQRTKAFSLSSN